MMTTLPEPQRDFLLTLAYLYMQNSKWDRALTLLRALHAIAPEDEQVARCLAFAYLQKGDAENAWRSALVGFRAPESPEVAGAGRLLVARALWMLGRAEEAQRTLEVADSPLQLGAAAAAPALPSPTR